MASKLLLDYKLQFQVGGWLGAWLDQDVNKLLTMSELNFKLRLAI